MKKRLLTLASAGLFYGFAGVSHAADLEAGKAVFDRLACASCHGDDAKTSTDPSYPILAVLTWELAVDGKLKLISKKEIRKQLGRSPDRYDALSLACWEPLSLHDGDLPPSAKGAGDDDDDDPWTPTLDPYAGADTWR